MIKFGWAKKTGIIEIKLFDLVGTNVVDLSHFAPAICLDLKITLSVNISVLINVLLLVFELLVSLLSYCLFCFACAARRFCFCCSRTICTGST